MNEERLDHLLDRYFDEALAPAEQTELEALLLSWPQARTLFWKRARFHALLRRRGRESWGSRLAVEQAAGGGGWSNLGALWKAWQRPLAWTTAAGLAAIVLFFTLHHSDDGKKSRTSAKRERTATAARASSGQGIATILRAVEVQWTGGDQRPGNVLGPGWLKFERGLVEVEFHRGARVVIEGPAEFELISDMQARCLFGKLRADVSPPAIGFEILSTNVRVVDRGTAFGLNVQRDGPAEIHVFHGAVDFSTTQPPHTERTLLQGKAVRVDASGKLSEIPNGALGFITGETVEKRANTAMAERYAAWNAESQRLRNDPALLVQYAFDSGSPITRTLRNDAPNAAAETQGTIIGCSWTDGRWPGKPALDFKQVGDRVRFALPRQYQELTCLMWVRLDAIERPYTALLMSGDAAVGELQWQMLGRGSLSFGKRNEPGWGAGKLYNAESPALLGPKRCGSWMQIGFVYDAGTRTVTHYLDGKKSKSVPMNADKPLTTGALEIGNWTPISGEPMEPVRAFNGRMDEFLVFSRALRAEEIQRLWDAGRPL